VVGREVVSKGRREASYLFCRAGALRELKHGVWEGWEC